MPELPEAENIVRTLAPRVVGQAIVSETYPGRRVWRTGPVDLIGKRIIAVRRYGKQVLFEFDHGYLLVRLGMTGALLIGGESNAYTRAELYLPRVTLRFDDIRQFGWFEYLDAAPAHLGPDPFEITPAEFAARLRARKTEAKRLLLDQRFLRGVGNIYADEALFRASIHPEARSGRLKPDRCGRLLSELQALLQEAIDAGGSSISDYVDATGAKGSFQERHRVYGREGEPCVNCGSAIEKIVLAQRGTHFCPRCQHK